MSSSAADSNEPDELILEGIVVTLDAAGHSNIAPMGPRVDRGVSHLQLRPYQTAQTYRNLKATLCGVFHVTDDVELLARAAIGNFQEPPQLVPVEGFACPRLADCCRWIAFCVERLDDAQARTTIDCRVVARGDVRAFFGLNRAKHAVVEAAILATRIGILPAEEIHRDLTRLAIPIQKTAGHQERCAFHLLRDFISQRLPTADS